MPGVGQFAARYKCHSVAFFQKQELEYGGKILLPASALDQLARLSITYPMLFSLGNPRFSDKLTHCGVLEFTAEEGHCYIPYWMMQLLLIEEGGIISVKSVTLPKGRFVRLQPHSTSFIDIFNPRAVLEKCLRSFSCLTEGDVILISYNSKHYYLSIVEVQPSTPSHGISIIDTDIQLEFAEPLDYKETTKTVAVASSSSSSSLTSSSSAPINIPSTSTTTPGSASNTPSSVTSSPKVTVFTGTGYTLSGKPVSGGSSPATLASAASTRPPASTTGTSKKQQDSDNDADSEEEILPVTAGGKKFSAFGGQGHSLRPQ